MNEGFYTCMGGLDGGEGYGESSGEGGWWRGETGHVDVEFGWLEESIAEE